MPAIHPDAHTHWSPVFPHLDGVYLMKFDEFDEDSEATTYHVRGGKTYTPEGERWVCHGGIWKCIGGLPD